MRRDPALDSDPNRDGWMRMGRVLAGRVDGLTGAAADAALGVNRFRREWGRWPTYTTGFPLPEPAF